MRSETLKEAVKEARRFIERAGKVKPHKICGIEIYTKETATVKRASMDLTRVLADLRQNR